jgi:hypothetical protein
MGAPVTDGNLGHLLLQVSRDQATDREEEANNPSAQNSNASGSAGNK